MSQHIRMKFYEFVLTKLTLLCMKGLLPCQPSFLGLCFRWFLLLTFFMATHLLRPTCVWMHTVRYQQQLNRCYIVCLQNLKRQVLTSTGFIIIVSSDVITWWPGMPSSLFVSFQNWEQLFENNSLLGISHGMVPVRTARVPITCTQFQLVKHCW